MNLTCKDRERIFEDGTATEWAALEAHAVTCATCAEEIRAWKSLSAAAKELRNYSPSPELWSRIERALAEGDARKARRREGQRWFLFLPNIHQQIFEKQAKHDQTLHRQVFYSLPSQVSV